MDRRRCAFCAESIKGEALLAMERLWHPNHFTCFECKQPIRQTFQENQGNQYCVNCFTGKFNPKCGGCGKTLEDKCITAMEKHWHEKCFVCTECQNPFREGEFYVIDNKPYDLDCHWGKRLEKHVKRTSSQPA